MRWILMILFLLILSCNTSREKIGISVVDGPKKEEAQASDSSDGATKKEEENLGDDKDFYEEGNESADSTKQQVPVEIPTATNAAAALNADTPTSSVKEEESKTSPTQNGSTDVQPTPSPDVTPPIELPKLPEIKPESNPTVNIGDCCYLVHHGDTIFSLSKKFKLQQDEFKKINELSGTADLKEGMIVRVKKPSQIKDKVHVVKSGDTLFSIAKRFGIKRDQLIKMNKMKSDSVKLGQKLIVVEGADIGFDNAKHEANVKKEIDKLSGRKKPEFRWPVKGRVLVKYGKTKDGRVNDGINIEAKKGAEVKSSEEGTVIYVGNELKQYGSIVIIQHSDDLLTIYGNLGDIIVKKGEFIGRAHKIAVVGEAGQYFPTGLFFSIRKYPTKVLDPEKLLPKL